MKLILHEAQKIADKANYHYKDGTRWDDIFKDEQELIAALKKVVIDWYLPLNLYHGDEYIFSFAKQLREGKTLTDRQMVRAKQLAKQIYIAAEISGCYEGGN